MEAEKMGFVTLKNLFNEKENLVYDSPKKAAEALDDLGLCMNWATLTPFGGGKTLCLFYQGWVYKHSVESCVVLPFNEDEYGFEYRFTKLLEDVFAPFIDLANDIFRSVILVTPHAHQKNCFFVTLNLFFRDDDQGSISSQITKVLQEACDSSDETNGKFFGLD